MSDGTTSSLDTAPDDGALGRELAERQRPLRARRSALAGATPDGGPGSLGRRTRSFSLASGLSLSTRRALGLAVPDVAVDGLPVAPPAEWDESMLAPERIRTGDATLDHIIATQSGRGTSSGSAPQRGLRSVIARRNTPTGRNTAPGASAHRLRPQSAPPSLNPDVRRAVSGDGSESRPRAPRSGPRAVAGAGSSRPPGSPTGRQARGRMGRSVSWSDEQGAPGSGSAPPVRAAGAVPVSGRTGASSPFEALADAPVALGGPAANAQLVAGLADHIVGPSRGATGWGLPGRAPSLAPSVSAPAAASSAPGAASRAASRRMAIRHQFGSNELASNPSASIAALQSVDRGVSPISAGVAPTAIGARSTRTSGAMPGPSPDATVRGVVGRRELVQPPMLAAAAVRVEEPTVAASLRADPPALALSSRPRRAFTPSTQPAPSVISTSGVLGATLGRPGVVDRVPFGGPMPRTDQVAVPAPGDDRITAGTRTMPGPGHPSVVTAGLPIGPGGVPTSAAAATAASRDPDGGDRQRSTRGLGSVAALMTPKPGVSAAPPPTDASPVAGQHGSAPVVTRFDHAARASRPLTQLGAPSAAGAAMLAAFGARATGAPLAAPWGRSGAPLVPVPQAVSSAAPGSSPPSAARPAPAQRPPMVASRPDMIDGPPADLPSVTSVAPPAAAAVTDPAERFNQMLAEGSGASLRRLPQRFDPIARAILPSISKVRISTNEASRRALASVGKVAATAGEVVHLARPLDTTRQTADILAHELTHVAHPSPLVRFYSDDRDSAEERLAREVGSIMSQAPVGSPPASPPPPPSTSSGSNGGTGGSTNGGGQSRSPNAGRPLPVPPTNGRPSGPNQTPPAAAAPPGVLHPSQRSSGVGGGVPGATIDVDRLLDALEARVLRELERRGRRWPRPM